MKYRACILAYIVYVCAAGAAGCGGDDAPTPPLEVVTTAALEPVLHDFVALLPYPNAVLRIADDPVADVAAAAAAGAADHRLRVAVVVGDDACKECFRLTRGAGGGSALTD